MRSYLAVFVVAALVAALWMPPLMAAGRIVGAVDNTRKPAVPRVGGWAILLGSLIALSLVGIVFDPTGHTLLAHAEPIGAVLLGAFAMLLVGTWDDIHPLRARTKLLFQVLIALGLYELGIRIELVSTPFGAAALAPIVGALLTVVWLVGIANAFNLLDGADGVAGGSAFFAAAAVFMMSVALGHPAIGLVAAALAGSLLGFLPFNFPPARAFLGDGGSLVAGFLLAGLAVRGSTKGPTLAAIAVPLIAFAVPVFDTTITLLRRTVRGRPLFERDESHLHHRMAQAGLSPRQVAVLIYVVSAGVAVLAMLFINPTARTYAVGLIVFGAALFIVSRFLRLHELNELARLARRGALQPRAVVLNVGLRRAAERLEGARSLDDLKGALAVLFERSEFDDVLLLVAPAGDRRGTALSWHLVDGAFVKGHGPLQADEWEVVCPFSGTGWGGELRLRRRLGRRSLLLDLNLLLEVVQPALTRAAAAVDATQLKRA